MDLIFKYLLIIVLSVIQISVRAQENKVSCLKMIHEVTCLECDNSELQILDESIKDFRIVFLGEAYHGDSTTIEAKTKFINYLHSKHGFKILLLEDNFYENLEMTDLMRKGFDRAKLSKEAFRMNGQYLSSAHENLREFICDNIDSLTVGGIDIGYNNLFSKRLIPDITSKLSKSDNSFINSKRWKNFIKYFGHLRQFAYSRSSYDFITKKASYDLYERTTTEIILKLMGKEDLKSRIQVQELKNSMGFMKWLIERPPIESGHLGSLGGLRDELMARNIIFFLENFDQKIIVSTSTYHMTKGMSPVKTMHDYLLELEPKFKGQIHSMPFVATGGNRGYVADYGYKVDSIKIDNPSIESLFKSTGFNFGLLPFSRNPTNCNDYFDSLNMNVSFALRKFNKWSNTYNSIFLIDKMSPDSFIEIDFDEVLMLQKFLSEIR